MSTIFTATSATDIHSADEMEAVLKQLYSVQKFEAPRTRTFRAGAMNWKTSNLEVARCEYDAHAAALFPEDGLVRCQLGLKGTSNFRRGAEPFVLTDGGAEVVPAGITFSAEFEPGFRQLVLRFESEVLAPLASRLLDRQVPALVFTPGVSANRHQQAAFRRLVFSVLQHLRSDTVGAPHALNSLTESIAIAFLYLADHNFSPRLRNWDARVSSWQLSRAEEFIAAHWALPMTIADLASAAGCSARALFVAFRNERQTTPMGFLKTYRLEQAHLMLLSADMNTSVLAVAQHCGFGNAGHFAEAYRRKYGELPSETLKGAKASG